MNRRIKRYCDTHIICQLSLFRGGYRNIRGCEFSAAAFGLATYRTRNDAYLSNSGLLTDAFNVSPGTIGHLFTAFLAPAAVLIPVGGILADRYGRRPVLITGLLLFGEGGIAIALIPIFESRWVFEGYRGWGLPSHSQPSSQASVISTRKAERQLDRAFESLSATSRKPCFRFSPACSSSPRGNSRFCCTRLRSPSVWHCSSGSTNRRRREKVRFRLATTMKPQVRQVDSDSTT